MREDGRAVSVPVRVDDGDGVVEVPSFDDAEDGAEDFFPVGCAQIGLGEGGKGRRRAEGGLVALHRGVTLQDRRTDKVPIGVAGNDDASSVERDLSTLLLRGRNETLHTLLRGRSDERPTAKSHGERPGFPEE